MERYNDWKEKAFCDQKCQQKFAIELLLKDGMGKEILAGMEEAEIPKKNDKKENQKQQHNKK